MATTPPLPENGLPATVHVLVDVVSRGKYLVNITLDMNYDDEVICDGLTAFCTGMIRPWMREAWIQYGGQIHGRRPDERRGEGA